MRPYNSVRELHTGPVVTIKCVCGERINLYSDECVEDCRSCGKRYQLGLTVDVYTLDENE